MRNIRAWLRGVGALAVSWALAVGGRAQQPPPADEGPLPGSGLTRQQIVDKFGDAPGKGSVEDGKTLFQGLCSHCHTFGEIGTFVGPDLSTVGSRFRTRDLLEAILWPSRTISDQYAMTSFTLDDGSVVTGLVSREDSQYVFLRTPEVPGGRGLPIPVARIKARRPADVSMMPEGLAAGLTLEQIEHMIAFLIRGR